jgi:rhodanese-related sulfurtransferase
MWLKNLITLFVLSICIHPATAQKSETELIQVNSLEFQALIEKGNGTLLDVRTKSEFNAEHIENSGQLNYYSSGFKRKLEMLPDDQPILLYCNTGYRSRKAASYLIKKGYTQVYNLEHGIMEWNLQELPVIEGDKSQLGTENMVSPDEYTQMISAESLVFIDFYAQWCGPCRKMMPMIDSLKTQYFGRIKVEKVNADISKKLIKELALIGVPHLVLYRNDQLLFEKNGLVSREELIAVFDKYLEE